MPPDKVADDQPRLNIADAMAWQRDAARLVLGAAPSGNPGPLVMSFCGTDSGKLPCPVMLIPGSLSDERVDQLS